MESRLERIERSGDREITMVCRLGDRSAIVSFPPPRYAQRDTAGRYGRVFGSILAIGDPRKKRRTKCIVSPKPQRTITYRCDFRHALRVREPSLGRVAKAIARRPIRV